MDNIFTNYIVDNIKQVITDKFTHLQHDEQRLLISSLTVLIDCISYVYNFNENTSQFVLELTRNKHIEWLSTLILPHLNTTENLSSFNDIYTKKYKDVDVLQEEPKYIYSNVQYNRFNRTTNKETQFNKYFIKHNMDLLFKTIFESSNKLYVNWISVIPYTLYDFKESILYRKTKKLFDEQQIQDIEFDKYGYYSKDVKNNVFGSLYIGDIYNTIKIFLYDEIKPIKFYLYDIKLEPLNVPFPLFVILSLFFEKKRMFVKNYNNISWFDLQDDDRTVFIEQYNRLKNALSNSITNDFIFEYGEIKGMDSQCSINRISLVKILKGLVVSFDNLFGENSAVIKSGYKNMKEFGLKQEYDEDDTYDITEEIKDNENINIDDIMNPMKIHEFIKIFNSISPIHFYNYLQYVNQKFKCTYYSKRFLNPFDGELEFNILSFGAKKNNFFQYLSLKNIYNYAKSFTHYEDGNKYLEYPSHWQSLTNDEKQIILNRINNIHRDWFDVKGYLRYYKLLGFIVFRPDDTIDISDIESINESLLSTDDNVNIDVLNAELYNLLRRSIIKVIFECLIYKGLLSKIVPNKYFGQEQKKIFNDITYFYKSYYYLTEKPYSTDNNLFVNSQKENVEWYNLTALHWISQLGFCHHFLNNRVMFIKGGTGVGKSTQVPKLFLYYLKALDYKSNGVVACTQPRQAPVENNARQVSVELGVPIYSDKHISVAERLAAIDLYKQDDDIENQENINIEDVENVENVENIEESEDVYVRKQLKEAENIKWYRTDNYSVQMSYRGDNKHVQKTNNLVLKFITDGTLLQELKNLSPLIKKYQNVMKTRIDVNNIYDVIIIDEAHEHGKNIDILLTMLKIYAFYNRSIRLVILSATISDDEPMYRRYYRDINDNLKYPFDTFIETKLIDRINVDRRYHIAPPGMTTLGEIKEFYHPGENGFDVIQRLIQHKLKGNILFFQPGEFEILQMIELLNNNTPDDIIAIPFYSSMSESKKQFVGDIYNNFKNLRISKTENFTKVLDLTKGTHIYNNYIIVATNIAEASLTIKGLYYVIDTGTRKLPTYDYNKKSIVITTQFISESNRLQRKGRVGRGVGENGEVHYLYKQNQLIENKIQYSISCEDIKDDLFNMLSDSVNNIFNINTYNHKIKTIRGIRFKKFDYLIKSNINTDKPYNYEGNPIHNDYINDNKNLYMYVSNNGGFDITQIIDNTGTFHLIHPDEPYLQRNITGKVIKSLNMTHVIVENNLIKSNKINSFITDLTNLNYLKNNIPTKFGSLINILSQDSFFKNVILFKIIIYSLFFDIDVQNYSIITCTLLDIVNTIPNNIFIQSFKYRYDMSKLIDTSAKSDFDKIYVLFKDLLKLLKINYYNMTNNSLHKQIINRDDTIDWTNTERSRLIGNIIDVYIDNVINSNIKQINEWCNDNLIVISHIKYFIKNYLTVIDILDRYKLDKYDNEIIIDIINKYKSDIQYKYTLSNKYISPFIMVQPYNICKCINNTNKYVSALQPSINNMYSIKQIKQLKQPNSTSLFVDGIFFNNMFVRNYIYYLSIDVNNDFIYCISYITLNDVLKYKHLLNTRFIDDRTLEKYFQKIISKKNSFVIDRDVQALYQIKSTIKQIINEIGI